MNFRFPHESKLLYKAVPILFLLYLITPLYAMLQRPMPDPVIGLCALSVFVFCYVHGFWYDRFRFPFTLVLLALIVYICRVSSPLGLLLGYYPSALMGLMSRLRDIRLSMAAMLGVFALVTVLQGVPLHSEDWLTLIPPMMLMLFIPFVMRMIRTSRELKSQLSTAHEEIARLTKIEERQRISRDLHDTLGHTLSLITLKSELAEKLIPAKPERAAAEIKDIQNTSRAALQQVRDLVSGMNALSVEDELEQARRILHAAGIRLAVEGDFSRSGIPPVARNMMGLCLREAVTNVVKHSMARVCTVTFEDLPQEFRMTVADDGQGRDAASPAAASSGRGLLGMKDRLELIQGRLEFHREPGAGAVLTVHIPKILKS